jgi:hypothetical protein
MVVIGGPPRPGRDCNRYGGRLLQYLGAVCQSIRMRRGNRRSGSPPRREPVPKPLMKPLDMDCWVLTRQPAQFRSDDIPQILPLDPCPQDQIRTDRLHDLYFRIGMSRQETGNAGILTV